MKKTLFLFVLLCAATTLFAQKTINAEAVARQHLRDNAQKWQLSSTDIADVGVQYLYSTEKNGLTHVYLIQQSGGIEVVNAIVNVNVTKEGTVLYAGNRFISNLKVNANQPVISASAAISALATHLGLAAPKDLQPTVTDAKKRLTFAANGIAFQDMHAQLRYQPIGNDGNARLAWDIDIDAVNGQDHWTARVDALTGEILDKTSWTIHCQFDHPDHNHSDFSLENQDKQPNTPLSNFSYFDKKNVENAVEKQTASVNLPLSNLAFLNNKNVENTSKLLDFQGETVRNATISATTTNLAEGKYRILPVPNESPLHGNFSLVQNVVDSIGSPFGWHDTTGTVGPDFTITRGNNVHAFLDLKNYNRSVGDEPNGGATLTFDFPYDKQAQSANQKNLAVTNLFYMNNYMHDMGYRYGFDEEAGNFQQNNYGRGGLGRDFVNANAQDGAELPDPTLNNANMSSPPDGFNGRMQMYLWSRRTARMLTVTAPAAAAGTYITGTAQFGKRVATTPLSGDIVVFNDGSTNPTFACSPSSARLTGKIALIDRGATLTPACSYGKKVLNAQDSGAIACIICSATTGLLNGINDTLTTVNVGSINIPIVTLNLTDCARLKAATAGLQGTIQRAAIDTVGADLIDGDFDNGIIAHEYGHGVSTRLTGGPLNSSCLNSGEQMGEGWSDFLGLISTVKVGDTGAKKRGIGNFALRYPIDSIGIRRYPYSTDMAINPHTYDNLFLPNGQVSPHPIGEIWCSTLWDMYWKFTDKYGFDPNIYNTNSGNGKAIQLVFDGMKIQPCAPGMLDGRDAIIAADKANNQGKNVCLIWEAFARRGMGYSASQGRGSSASDNIEAFDMPPSCSRAVTIVKNMTPSVSAGQVIEVKLRVFNNRDTFATVSISDTIPANATFITGSNTRTATVSGNTLSFTSFSILAGDSAIIIYRMRTDPTKKSVSKFYDGMEATPNNNWTTSSTGTTSWAVSDAYVNSGLSSFFADGMTTNTEKILRLNTAQNVSGQQPMLRFFHKYDTEGGFDAGVVEISRNNGATWDNIAPITFRSPATGRTYNTFSFADKTYWGASNGFVASYADLSSYNGQNILLRYRLRTDASTNSVGWAVDDVLMMDAVNYNAGVRIVATSGVGYRDTVRTVATQRGTIIEPEIRIDNKEINDLKVSIFPNPTQNVVTVVLNTPSVSTAKATILGLDGRIIAVQNLLNSTQINLSNLAAGLYFIKIETDKGVVQQKIVKQ